MVDKITGPGGVRNHASINLLSARVLRIVRNEKLLIPSDYNSVTSRAVSFGNRVYLMRDHHTALIHWARALSEGKIGYDGTLIHIDEHPDLGHSMTYVNKKIFGPNGYPISNEALLSETQRITMENDVFPDLLPEEQFIRPAIELRMVSEFVNIVPDGIGATSRKDLDIAHVDLTLGKLLRTLTARPNRSVILDVDLDFFNKKSLHYLDSQIAKILEIIRRAKPGVVTIAFSPAASNFRESYLTLEPEDCAKVISHILITLGLDRVEETYYPEPRRSYRESGK